MCLFIYVWHLMGDGVLVNGRIIERTIMYVMLSNEVPVWETRVKQMPPPPRQPAASHAFALDANRAIGYSLRHRYARGACTYANTIR